MLVLPQVQGFRLFCFKVGKKEHHGLLPVECVPACCTPQATNCPAPSRHACCSDLSTLLSCRSIFYARKIRARLTTRWGTHSLVAAARLLLQEALQDPRNQRFLLLSGEGAAAGSTCNHTCLPACGHVWRCSLLAA